MIPAKHLARFRNAAPFWLSLSLIPMAWVGAIYGGWWLALLPLSAWWLFTLLDSLTGLNLENGDPETGDDDLVSRHHHAVVSGAVCHHLWVDLVCDAQRPPVRV